MTCIKIKLFQKKYVAKHEKQWDEEKSLPRCQIVHQQYGVAVINTDRMVHNEHVEEVPPNSL